MITQRKHTRFKPDPGTFALIDLSPDQDAPFEPLLPALVMTEAYGGCGLVLLVTNELQKGAICKIKVGNLDPLPAEVRWRQTVDEHVLKIGLQYLKK